MVFLALGCGRGCFVLCISLFIVAFRVVLLLLACVFALFNSVVLIVIADMVWVWCLVLLLSCWLFI